MTFSPSSVDHYEADSSETVPIVPLESLSSSSLAPSSRHVSHSINGVNTKRQLNLRCFPDSLVDIFSGITEWTFKFWPARHGQCYGPNISV